MNEEYHGVFADGLEKVGGFSRFIGTRKTQANAQPSVIFVPTAGIMELQLSDKRTSQEMDPHRCMLSQVSDHSPRLNRGGMA